MTREKGGGRRPIVWKDKAAGNEQWSSYLPKDRATAWKLRGQKQTARYCEGNRSDFRPWAHDVHSGELDKAGLLEPSAGRCYQDAHDFHIWHKTTCIWCVQMPDTWTDICACKPHHGWCGGPRAAPHKEEYRESKQGERAAFQKLSFLSRKQHASSWDPGKCAGCWLQFMGQPACLYKETLGSSFTLFPEDQKSFLPSP